MEFGSVDEEQICDFKVGKKNKIIQKKKRLPITEEAVFVVQGDFSFARIEIPRGIEVLFIITIEDRSETSFLPPTAEISQRSR